MLAIAIAHPHKTEITIKTISSIIPAVLFLYLCKKTKPARIDNRSKIDVMKYTSVKTVSEKGKLCKKTKKIIGIEQVRKKNV
jgi:hypothetical protein